MAVFAAVAFATFFLEHDYLVAFYEGGSDFAYHFGTFHGGSAYFYFAVGVGKENAVKFYAVAFLYIVAQVVHIQKAVFLGLELLALDFYDYVHLFIENKLTR